MFYKKWNNLEEHWEVWNNNVQIQKSENSMPISHIKTKIGNDFEGSFFG